VSAPGQAQVVASGLGQESVAVPQHLPVASPPAPTSRLTSYALKAKRTPSIPYWVWTSPFDGTYRRRAWAWAEAVTAELVDGLRLISQPRADIYLHRWHSAIHSSVHVPRSLHAGATRTEPEAVGIRLLGMVELV